MLITKVKLKGAEHTGRNMYAMVRKYYIDMAPYSDYSLFEIFDLLKNLPFQADPVGIEWLKRPFYTMNRIGPGGDCDDKAIAGAAWAHLNSYPYHFVGVGRKKSGIRKISLSHVYLEVYILGRWILFDPTYSFNVPGQNLGGYDRIEVLKP